MAVSLWIQLHLELMQFLHLVIFEHHMISIIIPCDTANRVTYFWFSCCLFIAGNWTVKGMLTTGD